MNLLPDNILIIVVAALVLVLVVIIGSLELKLKRFMRGKNGANLEESFLNLNHETDKIRHKVIELIEAVDDLDNRAKKSLSRIETVRFTPFRGDGGNQSFATCFLDDTGDGVVISSLYSRDKVGIYAKPIKALKSEYELTKEEREAINKAAKA